MGFSQYSLRHFMADQIKKLFRNVPREQRSLWMGHVVRDGSRTTANYEFRRSGNARGCRAGHRLRNRTLIQQHCGRPLFAVDVLLTKKDLHAIGARVIPEMLRKQRVGGGGGSPAKPVSIAEFPASREFAGNFANFRPD